MMMRSDKPSLPGREVRDSILERLAELDQKVGPLSSTQKAILGTDGSVTLMLEALTGHPVAITTLRQEVVDAGPEEAARLDLPPGAKVNHREVLLVDSDTGEPLIHAVSHTPIDRLTDDARDDMMRADIPIGKIMKRHHIEARREVMDAWVSPADETTAGLFGICRHEPVLSRTYRIIHQGAPLMEITESFPYHRFRDERTVVVEAPSRIHLGLIDMHGGSGRVDGGVGIALRDPGVLLEARSSERLVVRGGDEESRQAVEDAARKTVAGLSLPSSVDITLRQTPPRHAGLGSGTQLALATATAIAALYGRECTTRELAGITGRGGTSGIGTAAFERGGFIIDGGHSRREKPLFLPSSDSAGISPAPVTVRHPFPEDWNILIAIPDIPGRVSGARETSIFQTHCPVPISEVQTICHEVMVRMLPGLVEHDLDLFGTAVNRLQEVGFKRVEMSLQPPVIPGLIQALRDAGAAGAGLSSFGPAVYAFTDTGRYDLESAAREYLEMVGGGRLQFTRASNNGAAVRMA
ncbi:MAG: beta-ribofuranosylaminobenzene 5'-phosphate synthase [Methanoculleaceae archaeon]